MPRPAFQVFALSPIVQNTVYNMHHVHHLLNCDFQIIDKEKTSQDQGETSHKEGE